jgi:hypothetical protein
MYTEVYHPHFTKDGKFDASIYVHQPMVMLTIIWLSRNDFMFYQSRVLSIGMLMICILFYTILELIDINNYVLDGSFLS